MYASTVLVEITTSFFHYASHVSQGEFHFSPRPNRAAEINWRSWSERAFAEAAPSTDQSCCRYRPCGATGATSWTRRRTRTRASSTSSTASTSHPGRQRPASDINQRYNMGGWPTTAFLTSSGELSPGTYMAPDQMADALGRVASYYHTHQPEIADRVLEAKKRVPRPRPAARARWTMRSSTPSSMR